MNWDLFLNENFATAVGFIAAGTCVAVFGWAVQRRKEREAFYRSEAIKKIAEMPSAPPEPVLKLLRDAVETWKEARPPWHMGPVQAKAYYRSETLKKIAEMHGGAESLVNFLREEEQITSRRQRNGMRLAGLICIAVGVAVPVMLWVMVPSPPNPPTYPVGLVPLLIGIILFIYSDKMGPDRAA